MKKTFLNVIGLLLRFLLIHTIASLFLTMVGVNEFFQLGIVILSAMALFTLFRKTISNAVVFVILHLLVLAILSFFSNGILYIAEIICVFFALADSFVIRFKNVELKGFNGLISLTFVICFIIGTHFGKNDFVKICIFESLLFVGLKFIFDGIANTIEFLEINEKISNMPIILIKKRTGLFLFFFAILIMLGMIFGMNSGIDNILEEFGKDILGFFHSAFGTHRNVVSEQSDFSVFSDMPMPDVSGLHIETGKKLPKIFESLGKILTFAAITAISIFFLKTVFLRVRKLLAKFYEKQNEHEISELIAPTKETFVNIFKTKFHFSKINDSPPNNIKIRKLYKKYILKRKDNEMLKTLTPYEISTTFSISHKENDIAIRRLYEKAKYGNVECKKDDVEYMKNLIKNKN